MVGLVTCIDASFGTYWENDMYLVDYSCLEVRWGYRPSIVPSTNPLGMKSTRKVYVQSL